MKVGIFLQEITPDSGGAFTFAETVIAGLLNSGIPDELTVYHYGSAGRFASDLGKISAKVSFRSLARWKFLGFLKRARYRICSNLLRKFAARLFHSFGVSLPYPSASPLDHASRRDGIDLIWFPTPGAEDVECPYVSTVWDLEHRAQPYFPEVHANGEWDMRERSFERALKRASYIITGTEVGKREICGSYGVNPDRIRLLPHPTPKFALDRGPGKASPVTLGVKSPYVIYPAQFWAHKNHIGLVDSVALLREQGIRIDCALVGSDKGNRKHVERRVKELGLESQIHFLGFVSREDLFALYQNAVALVYPSLCGPENLPPLEAMALGCPVIAADIEGAKEQLRDCATLVRATDPAAIAAAVRNLISNSELRNDLREKGLSRAKKYTEKEFIRDLAKILEEFRSIRRLWNSN